MTETGLLVALGFTFVAAFALALAFLGGRARERRAQRVRELVQTSGPEGSSDDGEDPSWLRSAAAGLGDRLAQREELARWFDERLERAGWSLKAGELAGAMVIAGLAGLALTLSLSGSLAFGMLMAGFFAAGPLVTMTLSIRRRAAAMHAQLVDIPMILAGSLRAGHSFLQALDTVAQEIDEPTAPEFHRVVSEIRLGKPVTEAMEGLADRLGSEDFRWAVMAVNIQRDVGGNLAEVLDAVGETMRERDRVRRQIKVLSAEGRLSITILTALPFLLTLYMLVVRPEYIGLLWQTRVGLVMVAVASGLMGLGFLWMKKVVKINV